MDKVYELTLKLKNMATGDLDRFTNATTSSYKKITDHMGKIKRSVFNLRNMVVGLVAALAFKKIAGSFMDMAISMERFEFQLRAVMDGNSAAAKQALKEIREFAYATPFEIAKVTEAYVMMSAVGIEVTEDMMTKIGDAAFAMGKEIENVANALVSMETEVLRRLGVMIDRTGKQAVVMSGNMRIVTENNIEAVREATLKMFGRFSGAMKEAETTWGGLTAQMKSAWDEFKIAVMGAGVFESMKEGLRNVFDEVQRLEKEGKLDEWAEGVARASLGLAKASLGLLGVFAQIPTAIANIRLAYHDLKSTLILTTSSVVDTWNYIKKELPMAYTKAIIEPHARDVKQVGEVVEHLAEAQRGLKSDTEGIAGELAKERVEIEKNNESMLETTKKLQAVIDKTEKFIDGLKNAKKATEELSKEEQDLYKRKKAQEKAFKDMLVVIEANTKNMSKYGTAIDKTKEEMQMWTDRLDTLKSKLAEIKASGVEIQTQPLIDTIKQVEAVIAGLNVKLDAEYTKTIKKRLKELEKFVAEKIKLEVGITDQIFKLTHSETENLIYELDKKRAILKEYKVDELKINEWYALELEKIHEDANEKIKDQTEGIWDDMADIFKTTFTDAVTNELKSLEDVWDMLWNRMKYKMVDNLGSMLSEWVKGIGEMQKNASMTVDMAHQAGIEGPGMASGQFFEGSTQLFDKAVDKFGGAVGVVSAAMPQIAAVYAIGKTIASLVPKSTGWQGEAGPKGYIQGMGEMGPPGATLGLFGLHPMTAGEERHMERVLKRVQEFYDEYNAIMEKEYSNLVDMVSDFNHLISSQHIEALEEMGHVSSSQVGSLHAVAEALGVMKNEAETAFAVSVGSMRRMETSAKQLALVIPEAADKIGSMTDKMRKLFMEDFMEKFERGLMDVDTAVKQLVRSGMSQLDAQTMLLGEDYNELIVMLGGSIEPIDKVSESFNEMYESLDELDALIADLPDSFGKVKQSLQELSYGLRFLLNMTQSLINTMEDLTELPEILESIGKAIKEGDWDQAAKDLYKLQKIALEASSAFAQLGEALDYLNFAGLGAAATGIGQFLAGLAGILAVIRMIAEMFGVWDDLLIGIQVIFLQLKITILEMRQDWADFWQTGEDFSSEIAETEQQIKDLNGEVDQTIDKFDLWLKKLEDMEASQIISNIAAGLREWQDIIDRFTLGDIAVDMNNMLFDMWKMMTQIEKMWGEEGLFPDPALYEKAMADLRAAMVIQINKYFDAIVDAFSDFQDKLKRDMQALSPEGRTAEDIWADMQELYKEMGGTGGRLPFTEDMDPNEYMEHAAEMRDLILERYAIEKEKILDLKDTILDLADQIDALRDKQRSWSADIQSMIDKMSGGVGEGAEQLTYWQKVIAGLRTDLSSAETLEDKEGILGELRNSYQSMMSVVESLKDEIGAESYQLLVDNTVKGLEELKAEGEEIYQNEMDVLQAQLDTQMKELAELTGISCLNVKMLRADEANEILLKNLNAKTIEELAWLDRQVVAAEGVLEEMRTGALAAIELGIEDLKNLLNGKVPAFKKIEDNTGEFLGGLTLVETAINTASLNIVTAINGIPRIAGPGIPFLGSRQTGGSIPEEGLYHLHPKEDVATPGFQRNVIDRLEKIESKQAANGGGDVYVLPASNVKVSKREWERIVKKDVLPAIQRMPHEKMGYDKQILKYHRGE